MLPPLYEYIVWITAVLCIILSCYILLDTESNEQQNFLYFRVVSASCHLQHLLLLFLYLEGKTVTRRQTGRNNRVWLISLLRKIINSDKIKNFVIHFGIRLAFPIPFLDLSLLRRQYIHAQAHPFTDTRMQVHRYT